MPSENRRAVRLAVAAAGGLALPHVYWLLVVTLGWPFTLLPNYAPLRIGVVLLLLGVLPTSLVVFLAARSRLSAIASGSLALLGAALASVLNYWAISWWYAEFFYHA